MPVQTCRSVSKRDLQKWNSRSELPKFKFPVKAANCTPWKLDGKNGKSK
jgi:ribosomal protein S8